MTRRREGQSLLKMINEVCPTCGGVGYIPRDVSVGIEARRQAREMALKNPSVGVLVTMNPEVACQFIGEDGEWARDFEETTGARLRVRADASFERRHVHFERILPGVALAGDLLPGSIAPLSRQGPFYPKAAPQFALVGRTLVSIDSLTELESSDGKAPDQKVLVEITEAGRHFAVGRITGK